MKRLLLILRLVMAVSVLGVAGCEQPPPLTDGLTLGQTFPEVSIVTLDGEQSSITAYRGKLVVMNLWATWCEPCRREMPNLQQLSDALDDKRFAVLGVAGDEDAHLVREYLRDKQIEFAKHIDYGQKMAGTQLGVQLYPYTFLIAPDGSLIQRIPGPREWHRPEVIELLEKAYAGDYTGL